MVTFRLDNHQDDSFLEIKAEVLEKRRFHASQRELLYDLVFNVGPELSRRYQLELGSRENRIVDLHFQCKRLQLKLAVFVKALNVRFQTDINVLEKQTEKDYDAYCLRLEQAKEMIAEANGLKMTLGTKDLKEMQNRYRRLVKRLHPDLHNDQDGDKNQPDSGERSTLLWNRIQDAYRHKDAEELEILEEVADAFLGDDLAEEPKKPKKGTDPLEFWEAQRKDIVAKINSLATKLAKLQLHFPYKYRDVLESPDRLKETQQEMDQIILAFQERIKFLESELQNVLRQFKDLPKQEES